MDISEKRLPQDGRLQHRNCDCRVSSCPTLLGEKIVIRFLKKHTDLFSIKELGFTQEQEKQFLNALHQPQGLIIVTGPTGSGKSSTLYSALNHLNQAEKNILTIEDPIEIQLNGINQTAVNRKAGLDFSTALRAFLRQDPDIIMLGEIRDAETAKIAAHAAQTGHLVFSTLHCNSAIETLERLKQLGIEKESIESCVKLITAQRLLRKVQKDGSYHGRFAIHELMSPTKEKNNPTLRQRAEKCIDQNLTTEKEYQRIIGDEYA